MQYKPFQQILLSRLGMGNMRLPAGTGLDGHGQIDWTKSQEMIDTCMKNGINYYDTAYVYNGGESERCLGACLKHHPRDSFYVATKFHIGSNPDYKAVFQEQLERLQMDHIDFYLLHCLMDGNADTYLKSGAIEYFLDLQKQGKITYLGFSSHASPETLKRFASHHQWDFAQIQLNYYDWIYGTAKEEYEVLCGMNIPVMVMEPVRGGRLAQLTPEAEKDLKAARPDASIASWALNFVKTLPGVQVILSGMSSMEQLTDNIASFSDPASLTDGEKQLLLDVCERFHKQIVVPCTACRYCCDGCPMQINIPEFLKFFNAYKVEGMWGLNGVEKVESAGKPADCLSCGACMSHCPQGIQIPDLLAELNEAMEKRAHR